MIYDVTVETEASGAVHQIEAESLSEARRLAESRFSNTKFSVTSVVEHTDANDEPDTLQ